MAATFGSLVEINFVILPQQIKANYSSCNMRPKA